VRAKSASWSLIENALDIITFFTTELCGMPVHLERIRYKPAGVVGKKISEYIHPDDIANACSTFTNTIHTDSTYQLSYVASIKMARGGILKPLVNNLSRRTQECCCQLSRRYRTMNEEIRCALEREKNSANCNLLSFLWHPTSSVHHSARF